MSRDLIHKENFLFPPNLADYHQTYRDFSWEKMRQELVDSQPDLNIARLAVERHCSGSLADKNALIWLSAKNEKKSYTYRDLQKLSNRFANILKDLGVGPGEKVFCLTGRIPELYLTALGTLKNKSVFCSLFSAFGPEPLKSRLQIGEAKVLVTTPLLYKNKIAPLLASLPALKKVIVIGKDTPAGTSNFAELLETASEKFTIPQTSSEDPALLHFTSGTTGKPKGAVHVHQAVIAHYATGKYALDLRPEDVFWCTADPGWITGISYGLIAPLLQGVTMIVSENDFLAEQWYQILQEQKVSVWYTSPTAVRMLMKNGMELLRPYSFPHLRFISSVGEPLNPECVIWGKEAFGLPFHDNWWQTETGAIMIANFPTLDIKPGSMGKPFPGIKAAIVRRKSDQSLELIEENNIQGELALSSGWPSMFRSYLQEDERYRASFQNGWYLTGDLARRDEDGYFWFIGRADDLIKSSGHLIGPFEVENVLLEHPAVAEAGVIGKPDQLIGEMIKAFVVLKNDYSPNLELKNALLAFARKKLGPAVSPRELEFKFSLPRTRSGKIMRRLLKARELGLPEGDLSTLESGGEK